jgi:RNA-directed DNA polymerase
MDQKRPFKLSLFMKNFQPTEFLKIQNKEDLASFFQTDLRKLDFVLYKLKPDEKYRSFSIKKRNGDDRRIHKPLSLLKDLQNMLKVSLDEFYSPRHCNFGYVKKKSALDNASVHLGQNKILHLDLQDFFESITFPRVFGLFTSSVFNFPREVAKRLAAICVYDKVLAQGSPTSPIISNFICHRLDQRLMSLSKVYGLKYSRYVDDLTFSTHRNTFPGKIAYIETSEGENRLQLGQTLTNAITEEGFQINKEKCWLKGSVQRKMITGLIVGNQLRVPRKFYRELRAQIHSLNNDGVNAATEKFLSKDKRNRTNTNFTIDDVIKGKLNYLKRVQPDSLQYLELSKRYSFYNPDFEFNQEEYEIAKNRLYYFIKQIKDLELSSTPHSRGLILEKLLGQLFKHFNILIRNEFRLFKENSNIILEQIDGVVEFDGHVYLVEMKWLKEKAGVTDISRHLVRVFLRDSVRGIFILNQPPTEAAIALCKDALKTRPITIVLLSEILKLLNQELDFKGFLREKIRAAQIEKDPISKIL